MIRLCIFLNFLLIPLVISAQDRRLFSVKGVVMDVDNSPLNGATVISNYKKTGTVCINDGRYELLLPKGIHVITVSYVGKKKIVRTVDVEASLTINFRMIDEAGIDEVVVKATKFNKTEGTNMGIESLSSSQIKQIPSMFGEVDVVKAIQRMPGVLPTSEGGSGYSVRGGSPDQNLVMFDNATVYNASHLLGIFSAFNSDVVGNATLYKGDMPVRYGGRLASLLDVNTKNISDKKITASGGLGLISSRLTLEGKIGNTFWLLGGRRSYADLFLKLSKDDMLRKSSLYFYDLNAKVSQRLGQNDVVNISAYRGHDNFGVDGQKFTYGNTTASAEWSHFFSDSLFCSTVVSFSDYSYDLSSEMEGYEMGWKSRIYDVAVGYDMWFHTKKIGVFNVGLLSQVHHFYPGKVWMKSNQDYEMAKSRSIESSVYASFQKNIGKSLSLKLGLRNVLYQNIGKTLLYSYNDDFDVCDSTQYGKGHIYNTFNAIEPRLSLAWRLSDKTSLKVNVVHNEQFIQVANNSAAGSPLDLWFSASPNIKPQKTEMYSVAYVANSEMFEWSVETYYKQMRNVIDFADHSILVLNPHLEGEVRSGRGMAYGIELSISKRIGKFTGFANYTFSHSERSIKAINNGKSYNAPFDRPHAFNIVSSYSLSEKHVINIAWVCMSGLPTTYPTGRFEINGEYFPIYSDRNSDRFPTYHRLDLSWTYKPHPTSTKKIKGEWVFSIFNAYGKKNPWMVSLNSDNGGVPYAEMTYLFGVLPSITYNFVF